MIPNQFVIFSEFNAGIGRVLMHNFKSLKLQEEVMNELVSMKRDDKEWKGECITNSSRCVHDQSCASQRDNNLL